MYEAKVILDSVSEAGHRLTTMQVTLPRIVLAELNTHRMFSRNSASSRAIPVKVMLEKVKNDPFFPLFWGKNQKGMQASVELSESEKAEANMAWLGLRDQAIKTVEYLALGALDVHKQIANRLLEPWLWHTVVISATEWANFFGLRRHKAAQPEINKPANWVWDVMEKSTPSNASDGYWHLPYVYGTSGQPRFPEDIDDALEIEKKGGDPWMSTLKKVSAGRCARVSYLTQEGQRAIPEDIRLYSNLETAGHMSPLEHPARPMTKRELDLYRRWNIETIRDGNTQYFSQIGVGPDVLKTMGYEIVESEETFFCGNYNGWIQLRKEFPYEHDFSQAARRK
jgi:thymidylate synthase ThyX